MNAIFKKLALTAVAAGMVFAGAVAAQDAPTVSVATNVNVRSGPGLEYTVRAVQERNFTVTGRTEFDLDTTCVGDNVGEGAWLRVGFAGGEGWVNRCVVKLTGDLATVPVVEAANPVLIAAVAQRNNRVTSASGDLLLADTDGVIAFVTTRAANVRQNPTVSSTRVGSLVRPEDGETYVYVTGRNEAGTWAQVTYNDGENVVTGWVARFLLQLPRDWKDNVAVK